MKNWLLRILLIFYNYNAYVIHCGGFRRNDNVLPMVLHAPGFKAGPEMSDESALRGMGALIGYYSSFSPPVPSLTKNATMTEKSTSLEMPSLPDLSEYNGFFNGILASRHQGGYTRLNGRGLNGGYPRSRQMKYYNNHLIYDVYNSDSYNEAYNLDQDSLYYRRHYSDYQGGNNGDYRHTLNHVYCRRQFDNRHNLVYNDRHHGTSYLANGENDGLDRDFSEFLNHYLYNIVNWNRNNGEGPAFLPG